MIQLVLTVLPFAVVMSITPGPNNFMLAASGANFGLRRSLAHVAGIAIGFPVMLILIGSGLKPVFDNAPGLHLALKAIGAAYLLYLAYRTATAAPPSHDGEGKARPLGFWQAAAFQWVNPKAWVIALGATTTYTTIGGHILGESLVIAATFAVSSVPILLLWTGVGVALGRLLADSPRALRSFNLLMGGLLAASLVTLL